ncbi:response regulator [Caldimonas brevitalea]|uniref:response regulator n=1 Tax=Caldimonas brevitalea TaxID=413882 RepID=UPI0009F906C4|nr:response regulator [Caldimonas brevitalea]
MKRMLVVDDHPVVAQCTASLFLNMQLADRVETCNTAAQTIQKLQSESDWFRIWLDVDIPGARGLSLIREARQLNLTPGTIDNNSAPSSMLCAQKAALMPCRSVSSMGISRPMH